MEENSQSSDWWNTSRTSSFKSNTPAATSTLSSSTTMVSVTASSFMDSTLHLSDFSLSTSCPADWRKSLLHKSSEREERCNFHPMLEETAIDTEEPSIISFREVNQPFLLETGECSRVTGTFLRTSSSSSVFDSMQMTDYQSHMIQKKPDINQLQFSNNSSFSNASDAAMNEIKTAFCFSNDDTLKSFDPKSAGCSNLAVMIAEGAKEKKMRCEYAMKKPRLIETPSPLPALKVKKEKLGDRITALQQLVSPFGKTDTASVLQEAIEYIKFLHDQVNILSTPYLKNGNPMQRKDQSSDESEDLKSRGLCLVPVASTYHIASETSAEFWNPIFERTYRP